jgi:LPXTG-motif cell wall-anchored protein
MLPRRRIGGGINVAFITLVVAFSVPVGGPLADTGSNVTPWAYAAGLVILLGGIVVAIVQLVRMRRVPPAPDEPDASPPDETPEEPISPDEPR